MMISLGITCQHTPWLLQDLAGYSQICWNFPVSYCLNHCFSRRKIRAIIFSLLLLFFLLALLN